MTALAGAALVVAAVLAQTAAPPEISTWLSIVRDGGVIGALTLAILAWIRGWVITGAQHEGEVDRLTAAHDRTIARIDAEVTRASAELVAVRAARDRREAELVEERNYWRDTSMRVLTVGEEAVASQKRR